MRVSACRNLNYPLNLSIQYAVVDGMADTVVLETTAERRTGSSPVGRTNIQIFKYARVVQW